MQKYKKKSIGHSINLLLVALLIVSLLPVDIMADSVNKDKKAIVLILDEISLEELEGANTPNLDRLMDRGSIGLMNTRAKSSTANRGSRYLSLGMGVRTLASTKGGWAFDRLEEDSLEEYKLAEGSTSPEDMYKLYVGKDAPEGELLNIAIGDIDRNAYKTTPNNEIGLLGMLAREEGLKIGLVGNGDSNRLSREASMLAMDERGVIPLGHIGSDLLKEDKSVISGKKLDENRMIEEVDRIINKTDILFLDYGDTSRVETSGDLALDHIRDEQKLLAIERGDRFLGEVFKKVNMDNTMFMVISPNPSKKMINDGNFGLTPVILSANGMEKGLLTSKTTRRDGLVTNFDFGPTLLDYFESDRTGEFIGESMASIANNSPRESLNKNYSDYLYLRSFRSVFHWIFIILTALTILGLYLRRFTKFKSIPKNILTHMGNTVLSIPLTMMTVSLFGYKNIFLDLIYVFLGAFLIGFLVNKLYKDDLRTMMIIGLGTAVFLLLDNFIIKKLMIISPLGSDAIAGGRFYGLGNDYMGILLGSSLLGLFILYEKSSLSRNSMLAIVLGVLGLIVVGLSPFVGANMGGTLSAMIVILLALSLMLEKKISFKKILITMILVGIGILLVAGIDIMFNPNPTHAGKAIEALLTGGGFGKLYEIISTKLRQVFWNIAYASWNIVLFLELIILGLLYRFRKNEILEVKNRYKKLFKGFSLILMGSLAIFLFNDTGTIAAALILIYLFIPLGLILNSEEERVS